MKSIKIIILLFTLLVFFALSSNHILNAKNDNSHGNSGKNKASKVQPEVGNVQEVTSTSLIFEDKKNKGKIQAQVDAKTKVIGGEKKVLKLKDLRFNDKVAVTSTDSATLPNDKGNKRALKVFVKQASESAQMKRRAVQGIVTNISGEMITLVHQIHQDRIYYVVSNASTVITMKGIQNPSIANIVVGQRIVAVGDLGENGSIIAKRIHVIPGKAKGVMKKLPPSSPTSSASASITPTISVTEIPATATGTLTPTSTPVIATSTPTPTRTPTPTPTP